MNERSSFDVVCFTLGFILLVGGIFLTIFFPDIERRTIWIVAVSISAALVVAFIPGAHQLSIPRFVTASGGVGIFVLLFLVLSRSEPLRAQLYELTKVRDNLASELADRDGKVDTLQTKLNNLQSDLGKLELLRAENSTFESALNECRDKVAKLTAADSNIKSELSKTIAANAKLKSDNSRLHDEVTAATTSIAEAKDKLALAENARSDCRDKLASSENAQSDCRQGCWSALMMIKTKVENITQGALSAREKIYLANRQAATASESSPRKCVEHASSLASTLNDATRESANIVDMTTELSKEFDGMQEQPPR